VAKNYVSSSFQKVIMPPNHKNAKFHQMSFYHFCVLWCFSVLVAKKIATSSFQKVNMPQNHQNTKFHQMSFYHFCVLWCFSVLVAKKIATSSFQKVNMPQNHQSRTCGTKNHQMHYYFVFFRALVF
jgi:hypothetical protein